MLTFLDGFPLPPPPPCSDCGVPGPVEGFVSFMLAWLLCVGFVIVPLPRRWSDAVIQAAFPFLPPKGDRNAD